MDPGSSAKAGKGELDNVKDTHTFHDENRNFDVILSRLGRSI